MTTNNHTNPKNRISIKPHEVTPEQLARCHRHVLGTHVYYTVDSESDPEASYTVRQYRNSFMLECNCWAGVHGQLDCKHRQWVLVAEWIYLTKLADEKRERQRPVLARDVSPSQKGSLNGSGRQGFSLTKQQIIQLPSGRRERTLTDQIVELPNGNEEKRYVNDVHPASPDKGLPSDVTLEGWIYWRDPATGTLDKLPYFYSESWRTWYPLSSVQQGQEPQKGA